MHDQLSAAEVSTLNAVPPSDLDQGAQPGGKISPRFEPPAGKFRLTLQGWYLGDCNAGGNLFVAIRGFIARLGRSGPGRKRAVRSDLRRCFQSRSDADQRKEPLTQTCTARRPTWSHAKVKFRSKAEQALAEFRPAWASRHRGRFPLQLRLRLRFAAFFAGEDFGRADLPRAGLSGSTATASISSSAPGRAKPDTAMVVDAGSALALR